LSLGAQRVTPVDLLVIGGGINGTGIARDAAGRGLSVVLCEKDDLAQGTSSRSGKLIHGGLRYLEYYEFRLVRESLIEREVVLSLAPHIVWPMRFVLPHNQGARPAWLVRMGLFLYDHLGGRKALPATRALNLHTAPEGKALRKAFKTAFEYSDCWVDDARLVLFNAQSAAQKSAEILPRTAFIKAQREGKYWRTELQDQRTGQIRIVKARAVVNAAGPWVEQVLHNTAAGQSRYRIRLVKGSHIVVPKFWQGSQAYLVQNSDKRVIFINPYEGDYALIGTTDIAYDGDADQVQIDDEEVRYLCDVVNRYFEKTLSPSDVVYKFSGVRPLFDDQSANPAAVTRDYSFDIEGDQDSPITLSIFGGKLTTYRKLAEHALHELKRYFPNMGPAWTATEALPGGDMPNADFEAYAQQFRLDYPWLPEAVAMHYLRLYGTLARKIIANAQSLDGLGIHFGSTLYECELRYLIEHEWAQSLDDILWRRTKYGLHLSAEQQQLLEQWLQRGNSVLGQFTVTGD